MIKTDANEDKKLNTTDIGRYNIDNLNNEGWSKVNTSPRNANWIDFNKLSTTEMQDKINSNIEAALKANVPLKKEKKEGERLKVHHKVLVLLRRKKRASRQLKSMELTYHKIYSLRKKIA